MNFALENLVSEMADCGLAMYRTSMGPWHVKRIDMRKPFPSDELMARIKRNASELSAYMTGLASAARCVGCRSATECLRGDGTCIEDAAMAQNGMRTTSPLVGSSQHQQTLIPRMTK